MRERVTVRAGVCVFPDSVWCVDHQDLRIYEQVSREIETKWLRSEQTIRDLQAQLTSLKELTESKEAQLKGKVHPTFPREIARAYFLCSLALPSHVPGSAR